MIYSESTYKVFERTLKALETSFPPETLKELSTLLKNGTIHDIKKILEIIDKLPHK